MTDVSDDYLISIIIPIYNSSDTISTCINSVLNQTYQHFEVLLINDGSEDTSLEICRNYEHNNCKIHVYHIEKRSGVSFARNVGLQNSKGYFIYFLDADDYLLSYAIEILISAYIKCPSDMVIGNHKVNLDGVFNKNNYMPQQNSFYIIEQEEELFINNLKYLSKNRLCTFTWNRLFLSQIILENNICFIENMNLYEDICFNIDYFMCIKSFQYINIPTYNYICNTNNEHSLSYSVDNFDIQFSFLRRMIERFIHFLNDRYGNSLKTDIYKNAGYYSYVNITITTIVRVMSRLQEDNKKYFLHTIKKLCNDKFLIHCFKSYKVEKGSSKIIPFALVHKLPRLCFWAARRRAIKRYNIKPHRKH